MNIIAVNKNTDWKAKYQGAIEEFETREREWHSLEDILRSAIGRLSIAGRGHDSKLDEQLKLIQTLSRKKKDENLQEAIEKLAVIVASLDDNNHQPAQNQDTDTVSVLGELLHKLQFNPQQQADFELIGSDLLKTISDNQESDKIHRQLGKLSDFINGKIGTEGPDDTGAEIIFQLIHLLTIDEDSRGQIDQQFQGIKSIDDQELKNLAEIINAQIDSTENLGNSIAEAVSSLLAKLSKTRGAPASVSKIQSRIKDGIKHELWPRILDEVATSISQTLDSLCGEKHELENLIVKVTEQISELSQFVFENHETHLSDHQDALSLQQLMRNGVAKIEEDVNSAQDIDQLKKVVTSNIHLIREGVESFVDRGNSRHEANEVKNRNLTRQISTMEMETSRLQKKLKESSEKLLHDTLTGVGSRLAYDEQIAQELSRGKRYGSSFSYAILDIDHFKRINDKYGHNAGDKALKMVAGLMMKQIRKSDFLYRIGGEEFALLVINTELSQAEALVQKIRATVAESGFHFKQKRIQLTLSAGITVMQDDDEVQTIYERADSALYRAKNSGRNCQFAA